MASEPAFEAVIHTASPYHFNATDKAQIDLLVHTAVQGTTEILEAVKAGAPGVKRVVITSSFAAIVDTDKPVDYTYSEVSCEQIF